MTNLPSAKRPVEDASDSPAYSPDYLRRLENLVTEDDTPVDNVFSEKQQRLLTEPLHSSWTGRRFAVFANVGLFFSIDEPPLVPDVMLTTDVEVPRNVFVKPHRSYFVWEYGKSPDVVIEVVSNKIGHEADTKLVDYARFGVKYYVIYDPEKLLGTEPLRVYRLGRSGYSQMARAWFADVGLGLRRWEGRYENLLATWLRWCDQDGEPIPTGAERSRLAEQAAAREKVRADEAKIRAEQEKTRAEQEKTRAEQEKTRAEQEKIRAEQEKAKAERLAARLRALGLDPDAIDD